MECDQEAEDLIGRLAQALSFVEFGCGEDDTGLPDRCVECGGVYPKTRIELPAGTRTGHLSRCSVDEALDDVPRHIWVRK